MLYHACVREANARQQDLEAAKQRIVSHVRKLVLQGDEVLRRVRPFPAAAPPQLSAPCPKTDSRAPGLAPSLPTASCRFQSLTAPLPQPHPVGVLPRG